MARKICIAGNWKMNKTIAEARELVRDLKDKVGDQDAVEVAVCPPFLALAAVSEELKNTNIGVGSQNIHWEQSGAFTGELSAEMLKEIGIEYVVIGHSERRQYFGETDETVNQRLKTALATGFIPMVCVGETLEQRESNATEDVVKRQIQGGLDGLSAEDMEKVIVAYEPVWAIGTGKTATPDQAQNVHAFIREQLRAKFGEVAERVRIQYGGSVKPANAAELLSQADIDGALVGGASLKADDFAGIIEQAPVQ
ncbi:MAG: triose-phosphate isomerase [Lentisphaeria bacterium]